MSAKLIVVLLLICHGDAFAQTPPIVFETRWNASVTDADKASILRLARMVSTRSIARVIVQPALPLSMPVVVVLYEEEVIGTSVIETSLMIHKKTAHYSQTFVDSLVLGDADWGTKHDLFRRTVLRRFTIGGTDITFAIDDSVSYGEVRALLEAMRQGAIAWEATTLPKFDLDPAKVGYVARSETPRQYQISLGGNPPIIYGITAEFDGSTFAVKRVSMGIP